MRDFSYERAVSIEAARQASAIAGTMLLAGGTTLLDLAKLNVVNPERLVDIGRLPGLDQIEISPDGLRIGALASMTAVAEHEGVAMQFPAVAQSLLSAASAQVRNMASIGGNLLQRTRCPYFRDPLTFPACNKRVPGSGCSAIGGVTRNHAVLGTSDACIAAYPGDLAVALVALDAVVDLGTRQVPVADFFLLPAETPHLETVLQPGELIEAVVIPASAAARNSLYLKVRDRQSYEFAAASAAVGLELAEDGRTIRDIRVALGGAATKPWRVPAVEQALIGEALDPALVADASRLAMQEAVAHGDNRSKIELAPRVITRAILSLGGLA